MHPGDRPDDPGDLAGTVLRRRDALARLAVLARRQGECLGADDPAALLEILAEREGLVREAVALTADLDGHSPALERLLDALPPWESRRLRGMIDESERLLEEISRRDAEDLGTLGGRREGLAAELTGNARARAAVGAYGPGTRVPPRVQDQEG